MNFIKAPVHRFAPSFLTRKFFFIRFGIYSFLSKKLKTYIVITNFLCAGKEPP